MANEEAGIAQMLLLTSSLGLRALHTLQGCGDKHLLILMIELNGGRHAGGRQARIQACRDAGRKAVRQAGRAFCMPACLPAFCSAWMPVCMLACLPNSLHACLPDCFSACLLACILEPVELEPATFHWQASSLTTRPLTSGPKFDIHVD